MRVLIDTHVFLWLFIEPKRVPQKVVEFLHETAANDFYLSILSAWEISIKYSVGKLKLPDAPERFVPNRMARAGFHSLPVQMAHALFVHNLPPFHKDPFDRLLISQAQAEGLKILTADPIFSKYNVDILDVLNFKL